MSVLTLTEVQEHLNLSTATTDDVELQGFIDAAESAITKKCGGLGPVEQTARVEGHSRTLVLPTAPVTSLVSVTPVGGVALDVASLYLDGPAGTVVSLDGSVFTARFYDVQIQAGRTVSPADLLLAAKEMVRHLWMTQRGSAPGSPGALPDIDGDPNAPSTAYSFPRRVQELMEPYLLVDL